MDPTRFLADFIDHLAPRLDVYEAAIYLYAARHSRLVGRDEATIGFKSARRRMSSGIGTAGSAMSEATCYEKLRSLESKGCVSILSSESGGTRLRLLLPNEIAGLVPVGRAAEPIDPDAIDFFEVEANRLLILEREQSRCFYCLRKVDAKNYVIEHVLSRPQGTNGFRNVVAACRQCNNRKGASPAADFVRLLYRDGFLDQAEFERRLAELDRLLRGDLKPNFERAVCD
jgi:hypothetical protein